MKVATRLNNWNRNNGRLAAANRSSRAVCDQFTAMHKAYQQQETADSQSGAVGGEEPTEAEARMAALVESARETARAAAPASSRARQQPDSFRSSGPGLTPGARPILGAARGGMPAPVPTPTARQQDRARERPSHATPDTELDLFGPAADSSADPASDAVDQGTPAPRRKKTRRADENAFVHGQRDELVSAVKDHNRSFDDRCAKEDAIEERKLILHEAEVAVVQSKETRDAELEKAREARETEREAREKEKAERERMLDMAREHRENERAERERQEWEASRLAKREAEERERQKWEMERRERERLLEEREAGRVLREGAHRLLTSRMQVLNEPSRLANMSVDEFQWLTRLAHGM